jgi:hypothetical protein
MSGIMGVDQYGRAYHDIGPHPRKELLAQFGLKHIERMYRDTKTGPKHVGYIIARRWITLYVVELWEKAA